MPTLDGQFIGAIYAAVDDPARWVTLMDLLRRQFGVESVASQLLETEQDMLLPVWCMRDSHSERLGPLHDSWANSPANPRFRRQFTPTSEMEIDSEERCVDLSIQGRHMLFDGLTRCGLGPAFWLSQQLEDGRNFTLIFHRVADDRRVWPIAMKCCCPRLAHHFRQAIRLGTRLSTSKARAGLAKGANDAMMAAMIACDRHLRIHWSNAEARAMFTAPDMLRHLAAPSRHDHERLLALVQGRCDHTAGDRRRRPPRISAPALPLFLLNILSCLATRCYWP